MEGNYTKDIFYILTFLAIFLAGVILKVTSSFAIPVFVALLLSCVFYPVVKKLNSRLKIPWILGIIVMVLVVVVVFALLSTVISASLTTFLNQYPKYERKFLTIYRIFAQTFNLPFSDEKTFVQNVWGQLKVRELAQNLLFALSGNLINLVRNIGVILLFMSFLLLEMKGGRRKVDAMFEGKTNSRVMSITQKIMGETVNFLSIKFFISLGTGALVFFSCLALRIDFAILWAFFSFILNFIPTFGSIFSVGLTTLFALLQYYPSPARIILIFCLMTAINFTLGNIVEPRIEGKRLGISPFVILVSLTFWGWMWGFVGMIIAVPLMVIVKIICENISFLQGLAILLGSGDERSGP